MWRAARASAILSVVQTVLHVAPHPDDELIGAPAALMGMQDAGYRVVNLAADLTRGPQRERRHAELRTACARAGFELVETPLAPAGTDPEDHLAGVVSGALDRIEPAVVVSPSPHDLHPAHERVARATRRALETREVSPRWWMWGLWGDLPLPNLLVAFDEARLARILKALAAHEQELARNDYRALVRGRAMMNSVLGCERIFGYGSGRAAGAEYAELLTEVVRHEGNWVAGEGRTLDVDDPLPAVRAGRSLTWWLDTPSISRH